jgi:large subunit ribosomal protein L1
MPNPRSGTVTDDVAEALKEIKQGGRVEYKMDKTANVGVVVGRRSFIPEHLIENISAVLESIGRARPQALKGRYILSMTISGTMSPSVKLDSSVYSRY